MASTKISEADETDDYNVTNHTQWLIYPSPFF